MNLIADAPAACGLASCFRREQGLAIVRFENRVVFETPDVVLEAIAWHFGE